jgi:GT2 family glycosyltransferase
MTSRTEPAVVDPSIDVVIPTHGGWGLTKSCLRHLAAQTVSHTVIVVDNASPDDTVSRVRDAFPELRVLELGANLGFPVACNRGVAAGCGEVVVLLNNDVDCPPTFLERLVAPFRDDSVGSVAAVLVQPDGVTLDSAGLTADRTFAGFPRLRGRPFSDAGVASPVLTGPAGAAAAYRRRAWEAVEGLDECLFMYGEDLDLALRLRAAGWGTALAVDALAVHEGSATSGHRSPVSRYHGGFGRGYALRRYGVLSGRNALRALVTEAVVIAGDAILSRDLQSLRGRAAGWHAAGRKGRGPALPADATDVAMGFLECLRLRRAAASP